MTQQLIRPPEATPVLYTTDEAATICGVSADELIELRDRKRGPVCGKCMETGQYQYTPDNLHKWLSAKNGKEMN